MEDTVTNPAETRALALLEAADFLRDAHFRDGLSVQEIGTALRHMADAADPMVGSLARDGFGYDEIATMLATTPPVDQALRDRIAHAIGDFMGAICSSDYELADAVLAVLPANTERAAVLVEAAAELGRMDYDTDSNDYGYDTYRDAWNGGVMDGAGLLRRLAAAPAAVAQDELKATDSVPDSGAPGSRP
jgi:hypothetical protein